MICYVSQKTYLCPLFCPNNDYVNINGCHDLKLWSPQHPKHPRTYEITNKLINLFSIMFELKLFKRHNVTKLNRLFSYKLLQIFFIKIPPFQLKSLWTMWILDWLLIYKLLQGKIGYETHLHHKSSIGSKGQEFSCNLFFQHPMFLHNWSNDQID